MSEQKNCCGGAQGSVPQEPAKVVEMVRERYGAIASGKASGCCGDEWKGEGTAEESIARTVGYTVEELSLLPEGANLGLGCGAPVPLLELQPGEVVLDLGSGAGIDALLAGRRVGPRGRVIGVDMTPEMIDRARANAERAGQPHVEFRLGRLEQLPVDDASIDAVTSNCVINLVPDKSRVFAEIARVLKPGGRLVISDMILDGDLPPEVTEDVLAYVGCVAGAVRREAYFDLLAAAGFGPAQILRDVDYLKSTGYIYAGVDHSGLDGIVRSVTYRAVRA